MGKINISSWQTSKPTKINKQNSRMQLLKLWKKRQIKGMGKILGRGRGNVGKSWHFQVAVIRRESRCNYYYFSTAFRWRRVAGIEKFAFLLAPRYVKMLFVPLLRLYLWQRNCLELNLHIVVCFYSFYWLWLYFCIADSPILIWRTLEEAYPIGNYVATYFILKCVEVIANRTFSLKIKFNWDFQNI